MTDDKNKDEDEISMDGAAFDALPDPPAEPETRVDGPSDETPPAGLPPTPSKPPSSVRKRPIGGKPGARPAGAPRPSLPPRKPDTRSFKIAMTVIVVLIGGLVAAGFAMGTWQVLLRKAGILSPAPTKTPAPVRYEMDDTFKAAGEKLAAVQAFATDDLKAFEDKHESQKPAVDDVKALIGRIDETTGKLNDVIDTLTTVRRESQKPPGARLTSISPTDSAAALRTAEELKEKLLKSSGAWSKKLRELNPRHVGTSQVMPDPLTARAISPWADLRPGTWWRVHVVPPAPGAEGWEDTIIDSTENDHVKGRTIVFSAGKKEERPFETDAADVNLKIGAEEKVDVEGKAIDCQIVEMTGPLKVWICRDPAALNLLALRGEGSGFSFKAATLSKEERNLNGKLIACAVVDVDMTAGGAATRQREWWSREVPGWLVRRESPEGAREVMDFGSSPETRPLFPGEATPTPTPEPTPEPTPTPSVPPPPDPKVEAQKRRDEGDALLAEATPLFKEVATAITALPDTNDALNALLAKASTAGQKLKDAAEKYREGRDLAPDPAVVDKRIASIDRVLLKLDGYIKEIQAKLK